MSITHDYEYARPIRGTADAERERRFELLISQLPARSQDAVRWLRRPSSKWIRVPAGVLLILGGVFSILPLLGLWMLPLGLLLIAEDVPPLRRATGRALCWIERHRPRWLGLSRSGDTCWSVHADEIGSRLMLKSVMLAILVAVGGAGAMAAGPWQEQLLRSYVQSSSYELTIARLAEARALHPDVRKYAAVLVTDHVALNEALHEAVPSTDMALATRMSPVNQKRIDRLTNMHGTAFDSAFLAEAQRVNTENLRAARRTMARTGDPGSRHLVERSARLDEKHEALARALASRNYAFKMPVIQPPPSGSAMPIIPPPAGGRMPVIPPPASSNPG